MIRGVATDPLVPGSPEWLATISASQIAAIAGTSKWDTAYSLYHLKTGSVDKQENASMDTGTHWEPAIRDWYRANNPDSFVTGEQSFRHFKHEWATANPDGIIDGERVLEIKTARYAHEWGPSGTDEIAAHYIAQPQWQMFVTGARACTFLMASPYEIFDRTYREYTIERDDDIIRRLFQVAEEFRLFTSLGVEPDPNWTIKADRDVLRATSGKRTETQCELTDATASEWLQARLEFASAEQRVEAAKAALLAEAGTARRLIWRNTEIAAFRNAKNGPALYPAQGLTDLTPELLATEKVDA